MTILNDPYGSSGPVNSVDPSAQLALQELESSLQGMTGLAESEIQLTCQVAMHPRMHLICQVAVYYSAHLICQIVIWQMVICQTVTWQTVTRHGLQRFDRREKCCLSLL